MPTLRYRSPALPVRAAAPNKSRSASFISRRLAAMGGASRANGSMATAAAAGCDCARASKRSHCCNCCRVQRGVRGVRMRWAAYLIAALTLAMVETANAQSVADTVAEFGLIGTWATDCTQPASSSNYLTVYAIKPSGEVSRTHYDKPDHVRDTYKITSAKRQAPDLLLYEQVWDLESYPADVAGNRMQVMLNMVDDKYQIVSSQGSDGSFFV